MFARKPRIFPVLKKKKRSSNKKPEQSNKYSKKDFPYFLKNLEVQIKKVDHFKIYMKKWICIL